MKLLILFASPRPRGNTAQLPDKITEVFDKSVEITRFDLYTMDLKSCIACRRCQKMTDRFHCVHDDDMQEIFDAALENDLILFATPIYSFYYKPCIIKVYRLSNVQTLCIFPCFCPYEPKQGKFFILRRSPYPAVLRKYASLPL